MKWSIVWSLRMDTATGEWSSSDLSGLWWHQCPSDFCKHFLSKHWLFRATLVSVTLVMGLSVDAVAAVFALARAWVWTCCSVPVQILWHSHNEARYRVPGFPGSRVPGFPVWSPYQALSPFITCQGSDPLKSKVAGSCAGPSGLLGTAASIGAWLWPLWQHPTGDSEKQLRLPTAALT